MDIICRELRSGDITKAIQKYESNDDNDKIILVPLLAYYLNTSENDQNKQRINMLDDFGPIQSAVGLYRADFDTIGEDLKKFKAALPKATYSVEEFGMNPEATIRSVFCSLLSPHPDVNLFNQSTHKSLILSVLVLASSYLADIIDIKEMFIALAKLPTGQFYIECLCLTKPHWIKIAIDGLLQTNALKENKIKSIICGIIKQSPQSAHNVQLICLRKMIHADLVINVLCLQTDRQFIKTFELIFLRKGKTLKWLTSQFSNSAVIDIKTVTLIRDKLISIMSSVASQLSDNDPPSITYAQSVLRVWCLLLNKCSVRFSLAETSKVMSVFEETLKLEIREKSRQLITACVSVAVSYPEFSTPSKPEKNSNDIEPYARLATWLHKLVTLTKTELGDSQGVEKMKGDPAEISQLAEFFLILSIHFHFDNRGQLEAVISRELQMHTSIKQQTINRLRNLFMTRLYTQKSLTKLALAVPPTQNLTSSEKGYIPLHAVTNLLEKREFTAHGIHTVRNWIFAQMKQCRIPFNQTVMTLIDNFINTNVPESKKEFSQIQPAIDYNQIIELACDSDAEILPRILAAYYVVALAASLMKNSALCYRSEFDFKKRIPFPHKALREIPLKLLLHKCEREASLREKLYPKFIATTTCVLPELLIFESIPDNSTRTIVSLNSEEINSITQKLFETVTNSNFEVSNGILEKIYSFDSNSILRFWNNPKSFQVLKDLNNPRWLSESMKNLWMRANTLTPRQLWTQTINNFSKKRNRDFEHYLEDPILAFQADSTIYQSPILIEIFLVAIKGILSCSSSYYTHQILTEFRPRKDLESFQSDLVDCEKIRANIIVTQKAAAVQILIELLVVNDKADSDQGKIEFYKQRQIQCLICCFIHYMFIDEPQLCKLIHFQGYPIEALKILVAGVPSMHICLSFLPELLRITDNSQRIFGLNLLAQLSLQYSMPKTLDMCRLALRIGLTMAQTLPEDELGPFFVQTIHAFVSMAGVFPPLSTLAIELLETLKNMAKYGENLTTEMPELHQSFKQLHTAIDEGFHQMIGAVKNDNKLISSE